MDWWALWTRTRPTLPSRSLDLTVRLICPGASLPSDLETPCGMVSSEDSEIDLLQGITRQRTLALLELDQPSSVTRSEHLALGVIYMLCDGQDRISTKGMELILTKLPNGGHDMLHLSVILGLTTLVREIARHLLNRYQSMFKDQHDHQPIELEVLSVDTNGLTALDFAVELGYYEIEQVLIATMEAANEHKDEYLSQLAAHPLPKPPRNVLINRPLPPTPTGSPFVSTPEGSTEAGSSVSYFPLSAGGDGVTIVSTPAPAQRIQTAQAIIGSIDDQHSQSTVVENASAYAHSNQSTIIGSPSSTGSEGFDLPYQQSQQPYYPQQQHLHQHYPQSMAHPQQQQQQQQYTGPYRANTEPLPPRQLPILSLLNQNHHSDDPRFHQQQQLQNPQVEQSPQQIYKSSVAPFRPLPATPLSQTAPLPPPKHIVKQTSTNPTGPTIYTNVAVDFVTVSSATALSPAAFASSSSSSTSSSTASSFTTVISASAASIPAATDPSVISATTYATITDATATS
ncbi:hypothetical protein BGZ83_008190 [Gryganskiella cystojenkinii]|nr:hypothetical protein BGZ83_008190 [Gryganskiella cystojenkinii]